MALMWSRRTSGRLMLAFTGVLMLLLLTACPVGGEEASDDPVSVTGPGETEGQWVIHLDGAPCEFWSDAGISPGALSEQFRLAALCRGTGGIITTGDVATVFVDGVQWNTALGESFTVSRAMGGTIALLGPLGDDPDSTPSPATPTPEPATPTPTPEPTATPEPTPTPDPLALVLPADMTVEATSIQGAVVAYTLPTTTGGAGTAAVQCAPTPGAPFPIGANTVLCTATDGTATATGSFVVTVADTTAPVITTPVDVTTTAGAVPAPVNFNVPNAVDTVDPAVTVVCDPLSGSGFVYGSTAVTCTATDASGNSAQATFNVIVEIPLETASGCPASGQGTNVPPLPVIFKGSITLDGSLAPAGTVVFARSTNLGVSTNLQKCDTAAATTEGAPYQVVFGPPIATSAWFSQIDFYVNGIKATPSRTLTFADYVGGGSVTVNLTASSTP